MSFSTRSHEAPFIDRGPGRCHEPTLPLTIVINIVNLRPSGDKSVWMRASEHILQPLQFPLKFVLVIESVLGQIRRLCRKAPAV